MGLINHVLCIVASQLHNSVLFRQTYMYIVYMYTYTVDVVTPGCIFLFLTLRTLTHSCL